MFHHDSKNTHFIGATYKCFHAKYDKHSNFKNYIIYIRMECMKDYTCCLS